MSGRNDRQLVKPNVKSNSKPFLVFDYEQLTRDTWLKSWTIRLQLGRFLKAADKTAQNGSNDVLNVS